MKEHIYENIRREKAFDYGKFFYESMLEFEEEVLDDQPVSTVIENATDYSRNYDVEHVNVAILWQDETVTIHCRMENCVYDIFWRIDSGLDCPVFAKGILVRPCESGLDLQDTCMHTFTIEINYKDGTPTTWNDPRLFFLKFADKDIDYNPAKNPEVDQ